MGSISTFIKNKYTVPPLPHEVVSLGQEHEVPTIVFKLLCVFFSQGYLQDTFRLVSSPHSHGLVYHAVLGNFEVLLPVERPHDELYVSADVELLLGDSSVQAQSAVDPHRVQVEQDYPDLL